MYTENIYKEGVFLDSERCISSSYASYSTSLVLPYLPFQFRSKHHLTSLEPPEKRMFLTLTPTMPRTDMGAIPPSQGFAVDIALKQASKDQVPGLMVPPASDDCKSEVTSAPNLRVRVDEIPPATESDSSGTNTLSNADSAIDTTSRDFKQDGELSLPGADPVTKEQNNHVNGNTVTSPPAGFMDKVAPPPTVIEGTVEDIPASPATRLKRRLENTTDLIVCPGVYDGLSARIALAVGCDAMYMVRGSLVYRERRTDYHSDWCRDHRFGARHGRSGRGHTH